MLVKLRYNPKAPRLVTSVSKTHSSAFNSLELPVFKHQQFQGSFHNCNEIYFPLSCLECYMILIFAIFMCALVTWPCNQSSAFDPSKVGPVSIQYASHVALFRQPALQCNLSNREVDKLPVKACWRFDVLGCTDVGTRNMANSFAQRWSRISGGFMNQLQRIQTTETWIELYIYIHKLSSSTGWTCQE